MVVAAVVVVVVASAAVLAAVLVTVVAAVLVVVLVTVLGSTVTFVPEWVAAVEVGEVVPPVRPIASASSCDWGCNLIQLCTSVWFS